MVKNILTFAAIAALAAPALAQQEAGIIDATKSVGNLAAKTVVASSANVTMSALYADTYSAVSLKTSGTGENVTEHVAGIAIGETTYAIGNGIQGKTNPSGAKLDKVPTAGAMFSIKAIAAGYLYLIAKVSSGKPIYVINDNDGSSVAYSVDVFTASGETSYSFTLPDNGTAGYFASVDEYSFADLTETQQGYVGGSKQNEIMSPAGCYTAAGSTGSWSGDAAGVVAFPVKADKTYLFYAAGSKVSCGGFVFDKGATEKLTVKAADATATALKQVKFSLDENAPIYNVLGQRVQKGYKGICIQNGKKFIVK